MVNSGNIRYALYPVVADKMVAGVALPTDDDATAKAWGAWTAVFAAETIATEFWLCGLQVLLCAGAAEEQRAVQIGSGAVGAAVALADWAFLLTKKATPNVGPFLLRHPILLPANTAMCGRAAETTKEAAQDQTVAILCATGL
ncbi:unnamed protein product [marine sediment metagenome]|uniref:Uncharacterized protein n=1 Tax=marine sediment metagenome TaxID=412755 RepID=X1P106_9ZZZZ